MWGNVVIEGMRIKIVIKRKRGGNLGFLEM